MRLETYTDNQISWRSQPKWSCISTTLLLRHPSVYLESSTPKDDLPPGADVQGIQVLPLTGSEKGNMWKSLPRRRTALLEENFYPPEWQTATQLLFTRRKRRLGKQLHTKCLDVPWRHGSCLPSTKLCFFVSWTTKKHLCVSQSQTPPKIQHLL